MGFNNKQKTLTHKLQVYLSPEQYYKLKDLKGKKYGITIGQIIRKLLDKEIQMMNIKQVCNDINDKIKNK